jgi:tetratricopeptide (TPR) repeat protein
METSTTSTVEGTAIDVLIVTAVKDECDAVLKVNTGATPETEWEPWPACTCMELFVRSFETEKGLLRIGVTRAFGMGREQAVMAAAPLLGQYPSIRCLAMCGVCAGRRGDVNLGDVIIADRTWPYDAGKLIVMTDDQGRRIERFQGDMDLYRIHPSEWKQRAERFQPDSIAPWIAERPRSYEAQANWLLERLVKGEDPSKHADRKTQCPDYEPVLRQLWKVKWLDDGEQTLTEAGKKHIRRLMTLQPDGLRDDDPFKVVVGPIASGAPVVQDETIFDRLSESSAMRKVLGLEMETSAILALAYLERLNYAIVMKGVMDHADIFKSDNMKAFAARASAECLIAFLRQNMPPQRAAREQQPQQLQAPVGDFVGRKEEIDHLVQRLRLVADRGGAPIGIIRGMGGVGKTQLANKVAQQLAVTFPDAQLFIELRGTSETFLSSAQALQAVIRAFESLAPVSNDLSILRDLYRRCLNGKRALIVADDAHDAAQVESLLPLPVGCALLVTSRNRFELDGSVPLNLGTLRPADAEYLLQTICPRIGEDAPKLAKLCSYLPLALRLSAKLLASDDTQRILPYLRQLETARLVHLRDLDDPHASIKESLQLSYNALPSDARRILAQLSVFASSFDLTAAIAVVDGDATVEDTLRLLRSRNLLECDSTTFGYDFSALDPDLVEEEEIIRYSLHDLVREFATAQLTKEEQQQAAFRHAQYYVQVAEDVRYKLNSTGQRLEPLWQFDQESAHIDAGWNWALIQASTADTEDTDGLLIRYFSALADIARFRYDPRLNIIPRLEAWQQAARRLGQHRSEGDALNNLGNAYAHLGEPQRAIELYEQSLAICGVLGDRRIGGRTLMCLGNAYFQLGELSKAIDYYQQSLAIFREVGDHRGKAQTLGNLGNVYFQLGELSKAIDYYQQCLDISRVIDPRSESISLSNLGNAYRKLGEFSKAIDYYQRGLVTYRNLGYRHGESWFKWELGLIYEQQGDLAQAVELMQASADYKREIGDPNSEQARAYVNQLRQRLSANAEPAAK